MIKCLLTISDWIQKILQAVLLVFGTVLTAVNVMQVAGRDLFFYSLPWSEQLSVWLFVWIIFLGYHLVLKNDDELTIDVLHFKNEKVQLCLDIIRDLFSLVMIIIFLVASVQFLQNSMQFPQKLSSMPVYKHVIYAIMPPSFALMALQKLTNLLIRVSKLLKGGHEA